MADFTITGVGDEERFSTDHGEFVSYEVDFEGSQGRGRAFHKRKAASPVPTIGETFDGELVQKNGKTELKRVWKQQGGSSNGGGKSPEQQKSIVRQHSQHMAIMWSAVLRGQGRLPEDASATEFLKKLTDHFQQDAEA